jgi:predicted lipoprotein with Yx(FWY)xxD motif
MKRLLIPAVVAAVVVGIAIAATGCGGGGTKGSTAPTSNTGGATVSAEQISGSGNVLVDSKGQALYASDQEKKMALCNGACLSFWTPLTIHGAPKANSLDGKLGVVTRPGGDKQVTFNGKLLYTFYLDSRGRSEETASTTPSAARSSPGTSSTRTGPRARPVTASRATPSPATSRWQLSRVRFRRARSCGGGAPELLRQRSPSQ